MHFALPPRKTSNPPPYARASAARTLSNTRKAQGQLLALALFTLCAIGLLLRSYLHHDPSAATRLGGDGEEEFFTDDADEEPRIVIVTVFDESAMSAEVMGKVRRNRDDYAARHGYTNFYTNTSTYHTLFFPAPNSWAMLPALRHALTLHPTSTHLFSLHPWALITTPTTPLTTILSPQHLPTLMIKDVPVVPPDSVIHTFSHLTPSQTHLVLSQDLDNLAHTSLLLRNSHWSRFFLDAWFDPLYRAYNFQKAEGHALEHIVQWHPTILAKLVLIPQRLINSYNYATAPEVDPDTAEVREVDTMWQAGDLLVNFKGCDESKERDCEAEFGEYFGRWERDVKKLDRGGELKVVKEEAGRSG